MPKSILTSRRNLEIQNGSAWPFRTGFMLRASCDTQVIISSPGSEVLTVSPSFGILSSLSAPRSLDLSGFSLPFVILGDGVRSPRFVAVRLFFPTQCRILPGGQQSFGDGESLRRRPLELPIEPRSESRLAGTCHLLTILCGCGFELRAPLLAPARARRTKNRSHARRS